MCMVLNIDRLQTDQTLFINDLKQSISIEEQNKYFHFDNGVVTYFNKTLKNHMHVIKYMYMYTSVSVGSKITFIKQTLKKKVP